MRLTIATLALAALAPFGPLGCPPTDAVSEDQGITARGSIPTEAEAPQTATAGETVTLHASADANGVHYTWLQTAGPGVPIIHAMRAAARFTAPSLETEKTLRFMVTTRNEDGAVGQAVVSVAVAADPNYGTDTSGATRALADAGSDQRAKPGSEVVLDGSSSCGVSLTYRWRQVSGERVEFSDADSARAKFTVPEFDPEGTNVLLFELAVTDVNGHMATDRTQLTILDPAISDSEVRVTTTLGAFTIELELEKSPITVENFLRYVDEGFYDGTIIHRAVPEFVVQGGGYLPGMEEKDTHDPIVNEADNGLSNVRGTVAMARTQDPDSATSQFFINVIDNTEDGDGLADLDPGGITDAGYAVFGRVTQGMDVVDEIAAVETDDMDTPLEDIIVESIARVVNRPAGAGTSTGTSSSSGHLAQPPSDGTLQSSGDVTTGTVTGDGESPLSRSDEDTPESPE